MTQLIVEGDGEVKAAPVLIRRLLNALAVYGLGVGRPVLAKRTQLVQETGLRNAIRKAKVYRDATAIIILFDSDKDRARDLVPSMTAWAQTEAPPVPWAIVMARCEYEAWFLAALTSLRGKHGVPSNATYDRPPEETNGAKGIIKDLIRGTYNYAPADQEALSAQIDLGQCYRNSSSFRKLVKELCRVLGEIGYPASLPAEWQAA
jgi:hypothetical protein